MKVTSGPTFPHGETGAEDRRKGGRLSSQGPKGRKDSWILRKEGRDGGREVTFFRFISYLKTRSK